MAIRRKKKAQKAPQTVSNRGNQSQDQFTGFGGVFSITDEDEKKIKRRRKGASQVTIAQKYGGRRKIFLALGLSLILALGLGLMNWARLGTVVTKADLQNQVTKAIENSGVGSFPRGEAQMWGERFLRVWGTWNSQTSAGRAAALSPYISPAMDPQAGWDGTGKQNVIYSAVSSDPVIINSSRAILSGTYQIQDGTWRCVDIPVFSYKPQSDEEGPSQWGFTATANPVPRPCSLQVTVPRFDEMVIGNRDNEAEQALKEQFFPGFFSAWATSDANTLNQYVSPNIKTFGLGGAYTSEVRVNSVILPTGDGASKAQAGQAYTAYVEVVLKDYNGPSVTTTYKVPVQSSGTQWQVVGEPLAIPQVVGGGGGAPKKGEGVDPSSKEAQTYDQGVESVQEHPESVTMEGKKNGEGEE